MAQNDQAVAMEDEVYEDEDTQKDKYLTFNLAGEDYGIEIAFVTEIIGIQKIVEAPDMPDFIKGVINLRGKVIPVMDVRARFKQAHRDYDDRTCIVVVNVEDYTVGLVVDEVREVADIPEAQVEPPPKSGRNKKSSFIKGMGKLDDEVKIILDVEQLLYDDELEELEELAEVV